MQAYQTSAEDQRPLEYTGRLKDPRREVTIYPTFLCDIVFGAIMNNIATGRDVRRDANANSPRPND